ncbi:MAG: hypothetical protein A2020_01335 [Lentisphaerae bacterium GWF2_45_14]|nr:MAG: hypothetical protein A2020_01335 [Lentisphaerae bacterium GWF2_45_14]
MNNTLKNGFKVLEFLAEKAEAYSVKELAQVFKLPNSHICRLLKTLKDTGYIAQDSSRKYVISLKILNLSHACLSRLEIRNRLRPFVKKLSEELKLPVYLSIPLNWHPIVVDVAQPEGKVIDPVISIGSMNPIHVSATGKICAAFHPQETLDEFLATVSFSKITEKTIGDPKSFKVELAKIRKEKFAITNMERSDNISAIASPVFNCEGELAAVIGVSFSPPDMKESDLRKLREKTYEAAENSSYALGYALYKAV